MTNPVIWLSGAEQDILQRTRDRARYFGIGSAVLITSTIAALSMTFALHTALRMSLAVAIFCAALWGLAIMNIDRWLVVSLQRHENKVIYALLVLIRLGLGLLFGFIISTPVVLQVFNPEINHEIRLIQANAENAYLSAQKHSSLEMKILADQTTVAGLRQTIDTNGGTGPDPFQNPQVTSLVTSRGQWQARATTDFNEWQCQLYDIPKGCKPGNGPLAKASGAAYYHDEYEVGQLNQQITALVTQIQSAAATGRGNALAAAKAQLPSALALLQSDRTQQTLLLDNFQTQNADTAGLLLRLRALGEATGNDGVLRLARWLLFALFTTIECLPILVKTLLNLGPESNYEKELAMEEARSLRTAQERIKREQVADLIGLDDIISQANRLAEERRRGYPKLRRVIIAAEEEIALKTVHGWKAREARFAGEAGRLRRTWRAVQLRLANRAAAT